MHDKRALALSGGGLKGAFAVGAVLALRDRGVDRYDIVSGTSTGALIAPMALLGAFDRIEAAYGAANTESVYQALSKLEVLSQVLDAVLKGKAGVPTHLGTMDPLRRRVAETLSEADWRELVRLAREERRELYLTTVDLQTGALVYWTLAGPRSRPGEHHGRIIDSRERLIEVMVASSTIPVAAPPVDLPDDGAPHQHVDGGVREQVPAWVCVERGATELYVVVLQPSAEARGRRITVDDEGPKPVGPRRYEDGQALLERVVNLLSDEGRADEVRLLYAAAGFQTYRRRLREAFAGVADAAAVARAMDAVPLPEALRRVKLKKFHLIRPEATLPIGTLKATSEQMQALIAYGRSQAGHALDGPGAGYEPLIA